MPTEAQIGFGMTISGVSGELKSLSWDGASCTDIELASAVSADGFKEFKAGLKDGGSITATVLFTGNAEVATLGTEAAFTLKFGSASATMSFTGYINSVAINSEVEGAIEKTIGIKISGKPTFGAGA